MTGYREGDEYEFAVVKRITTPGNKEFFVIEGPDRRRFLIPVSYYSAYGIETGTSVLCRIDRINCKGEVFIEPRNPWYIEGLTYGFTVKGTGFTTGEDGRKTRVLIVTDKSGGETPVLLRGMAPAPGRSTRLLVERISKGRLFLRKDSLRRYSSLMEIGKTYDFRVGRISTGIDGSEFFIITDQFGKQHLLPVKYYESYGLKPGSSFKGKIVKFRSTGVAVIEPENPYFKEGDVVEMLVSGSYRNPVGDSFMVNLTDSFGFSHCVELEKQPSEKVLKLTVVRIRKGKPLLQLF
jgi:hypothetical protein